MIKIATSAVGSICFAIYAVWSVVDQSPSWKVVVTGLAALALAGQALKLWRQRMRKGPADPTESELPPSASQVLVVNNEGVEPLEVMIEVSPDRYVLRPGATMVIEAVMDGYRFDITPYRNGLQIYAGNDINPKVLIDGVVVEPDWDTPTPNSN